MTEGECSVDLEMTAAAAAENGFDDCLVLSSV